MAQAVRDAAKDYQNIDEENARRARTVAGA
jgi:hypothetical protein